MKCSKNYKMYEDLMERDGKVWCSFHNKFHYSNKYNALKGLSALLGGTIWTLKLIRRSVFYFFLGWTLLFAFGFFI